MQRSQATKGLNAISLLGIVPEQATTQTHSSKSIKKRSVFSVYTPASAWASTLLKWLAFIGRISKVAAFSLLSSLPVAYGADGAIGDGNDFSNNLFSDLAPLMTLFGEQVTKQFISQSMGWADNILLATAPLGVLTVIVSAIRVGGEQWLKNVIGRARESNGVAEAELMSSTSSDVCELWGGRGVVRVLGSPDLVELVYKVDSNGNFIRKSEARYRNTEDSIRNLKGAIDDNLYTIKSKENPTESTAFKEPPNLILNVCGSGVGEKELWLYAALGIFLQVLVWVWCILAVAFFKYEKGTDAVKPYALPMTITGSLFVCLGVLMCSHSVEASTTEHVYQRQENVRTVFLQRGGQIVNDQRFEGYAIFTNPNQKEIKTSCKNKANFGVLISLATILSLVGFVSQFIGLRAMHWSCTISQLLATIIMTIFRAAARRGLSNITDAAPVTEGYELQWLAKNLNRNDHWTVETGFVDLNQKEMSSRLIDKAKKNSAEAVVSSLQELLIITDWERPLQKLARSTGRAMENILNAITNEKEITVAPEFLNLWRVNCQFPISCNGSSTIIDFDVTRHTSYGRKPQFGPWVADTSKLEAILSLWMFSQSQVQEDWNIAVKIEKVRDQKNAIAIEKLRNDALEIDKLRNDALEIDKLLKVQKQKPLSPQKDDQNPTKRQQILLELVLARDRVPLNSFQQILGRFGEQRDHDYATWMETRGRGGLSDCWRGLVSRYLNGPLTINAMPWHASFGFGLGAYSDELADPDGKEKYYTINTRASKNDILGLDLVAKFMWEATKNILEIRGVTRRRIIDLEESKSSLVNSVLNKMAESIVEAGLGDLQDAYNILIPPLSDARKLPSEDINATKKVIEV